MAWLTIQLKHYLYQYTSFLLRKVRATSAGQGEQRSWKSTQGSGRRAQSFLVFALCSVLPAPSPLLPAFKLPFLFFGILYIFLIHVFSR